jgi:hypothetical protein
VQVFFHVAPVKGLIALPLLPGPRSQSSTSLHKKNRESHFLLENLKIREFRNFHPLHKNWKRFDLQTIELILLIY